ncbi:hypothetical protein XBP1_40002 [Xenorhabdus bovienii str. puntauvense]|uniref:Uncharacterized protein n=1 Tax=Xenorhabdus bovienii str. puntauvense TaxID=1398201 RepID=A0A077N8S4_XENBV|nr:hypothetical protein XBP1_40002 [Xenorhabdus bovienii str. puntauvense]
MNYMFSFSHFYYSGIDVNDSEKLLFVNDEFSPAEVWHWA